MLDADEEREQNDEWCGGSARQSRLCLMIRSRFDRDADEYQSGKRHRRPGLRNEKVVPSVHDRAVYPLNIIECQQEHGIDGEPVFDGVVTAHDERHGCLRMTLGGRDQGGDASDHCQGRALASTIQAHARLIFSPCRCAI